MRRFTISMLFLPDLRWRLLLGGRALAVGVLDSNRTVLGGVRLAPTGGVTYRPSGEGVVHVEQHHPRRFVLLQLSVVAAGKLRVVTCLHRLIGRASELTFTTSDMLVFFLAEGYMIIKGVLDSARSWLHNGLRKTRKS
jgi:hypothetical protein